MKKVSMVMLCAVVLGASAWAVESRVMKGTRQPVAREEVYIEDSYKIALEGILDAMADKEEALALVNRAIERETEAIESLLSMIRSRDFRDMEPRDIFRAALNIYQAAAREYRCRQELTRSIGNLETSLELLGWETPVSQWLLDEGEGEVVSDSVGGNDGTLVSGSWVEGVIGSGIYFDGGRDYVAVPDTDDSLDFGQGQDFSISLWFKVGEHSRTDDPWLINKRSVSGENRGYLLFYGDRSSLPYYRKLNFFLDCGPAIIISSATYIDDGLWHHTVVQREGQTLRLYLDGVMETEQTSPEYDGDLSNDNPLIMGMNHTLEYKDYYGCLDEVAVYGAALKRQQIELLYEEGASDLQQD